MRHGIVEGEPGIFPAPIARFFQAIGRLFGRRSGGAHTTGSPPPRSPGDPTASPTTDVSDLDPIPPDTAAQERDDTPKAP